MEENEKKKIIVKAKTNTTISEIAKKQIEESKYPVVGAIFNNEYKNLDDELQEDGTLELININSNNVLDKIGDEYFNTNITKVSEIQKIKVDDHLNLIRNLRPNLDDNNDLKIEPSFDGILPSTISYSKDNKVNKVAFSPSVCDSSKLLLGKCPSRFNEVVINKNLEKNISEKDEIKLKKDIDFSINTGKNYAHDYISFDFALKIVGIAKESSLFNTQTIYYDYYEMQRYFELIKLENISKFFQNKSL